MQELTFEQVEEVSGGNPVVVMLAVVAIRAATPYIVRGAVAVASAVAGAIGTSDGESAAK
jgi:hypothetical protein